MKKLLLVFALFFIIGAGPAYSESIKLVWDANSETDLAGYRVYSSTISGGPYTMIQDVGNVIELTLNMNGVSEGIIYYVCTAYDQRGNESEYSNQAEYIVDHTAPAKPTGCTVVEIK